MALAQKIADYGRSLYGAMHPWGSSKPVASRAARAEEQLVAAIKDFLKLPKFDAVKYSTAAKALEAQQARDAKERSKRHAAQVDRRVTQLERKHAAERKAHMEAEPLDKRDAESDEEDGRSVREAFESDGPDESE